MKNKLLVIALILFAFTSCNEEHFANKVMKDIGNGKYVSLSFDDYSSKILDLYKNDDVFSFLEVNNAEAKQRYEIENKEAYFQTDIMFDSFNLIESIHSNVEILSISILPKNETEVYRKYWRDLRLEKNLTDKNYMPLSDSSYVSTLFPNIDKYYIKYKVSTKQADRIAYLTVMKIPDKGYRVTSFIVQ